MKAGGLDVELDHHVSKQRVLGSHQAYIMDSSMKIGGINARLKCSGSMPGGKVPVSSYSTRMMSVSIMSRDETGYHTGVTTCIALHVMADVDLLQ